MNDEVAPYVGRWKSDAGHRLRVLRLPLWEYTAHYYAPKSWPRVLLLCIAIEGQLVIPVTWASTLGTTLEFCLASEVATRKRVLIPRVQSGPESDWWEEGFGAKWAYPLSLFREA